MIVPVAKLEPAIWWLWICGVARVSCTSLMKNRVRMNGCYQGRSEEMDRFIAEMPDWTTTVSWVSHWQQHRLDLLDIEGLVSH